MYDYVVVGSGFFGSVFAKEMTQAGARCLVVEERNHIGGNSYTENVDGIDVHEYGPHIFHTNSESIWKYITQFATFNRFSNRVKVNYRGRFYSFPINLTTLNQLWGVSTPQQATERLETERVKIANPSNLEEWALSAVGRDLYETFIYGYTRKQWGCEPKDLPSSIIRRIPVRMNWDDDYFDDRYCGIPIGGYTQIFNKLLENIDVETGADFVQDRERFEGIGKKIVYTGPLDRLMDYQFGVLDWRSLSFRHQIYETPDYQGVAVINYTDEMIPYTRSVEHKHFAPVPTPQTVVTQEYPATWSVGKERYYPINNETNHKLQQKYQSKLPANYIVGGRLGTYRYLDMHQVIASALKAAETEISGLQNSAFHFLSSV